MRYETPKIVVKQKSCCIFSPKTWAIKVNSEVFILKRNTLLFSTLIVVIFSFSYNKSFIKKDK